MQRYIADRMARLLLGPTRSAPTNRRYTIEYYIRIRALSSRKGHARDDDAEFGSRVGVGLLHRHIQWSTRRREYTYDKISAPYFV